MPKDILHVNKGTNLSSTEIAKRLNQVFSAISQDLQGFEGKKLETAQGLNVSKEHIKPENYHLLSDFVS